MIYFFIDVVPLLSSSIGCLRAVMSLKEQRKRTTTSRSFFTGDTCSKSQSGVPMGKKEKNIVSSGTGPRIRYRKSSIRSRPCIILNPNFPRLVLEVFQKL